MDEQQRQWRRKKGKYLFPEGNLTRVFRAKWFEAMRIAGLSTQASLPDQWVVDCQHVGRGEKALIYLGRYLYRGVLPEKNILAENDGKITLRYKEASGAVRTRTLPAEEFLWLLLQILLRVVMPRHKPKEERAPVLCPRCGNSMVIITTGIEMLTPMLC